MQFHTFTNTVEKYGAEIDFHYEQVFLHSWVSDKYIKRNPQPVSNTYLLRDRSKEYEQNYFFKQFSFALKHKKAQIIKFVKIQWSLWKRE